MEMLDPEAGTHAAVASVDVLEPLQLLRTQGGLLQARPNADGKVPPLPEEQAAIIAENYHISMSTGHKWAVVHAKWARNWAAYVGFDFLSGKVQPRDLNASRPDMIDNTTLSNPENNFELRHDLLEHRDYVLVHHDVWAYLKLWYGGGPEYIRSVTTIGLHRQTKLDLYPQFLRLIWCDLQTGQPTTKASMVPVSRKTTFHTVLTQLSEQLDDILMPIDEDTKQSDYIFPVRLWHLEVHDGQDHILTEHDISTDNSLEWRLLQGDDLTVLLNYLQLSSVATFLLEFKRADGTWPRQLDERDWRDFRVGDIIDARDTVNKWYESTVRDVRPTEVYVHYNGWPKDWDEWVPRDSDRLAARGTHADGPRDSQPRWGHVGHEIGKPLQRGLVGLQNLGNTCFMNSILQCMSNTPLLTSYFIGDRYVSEINRSNPLGWQGRVAEEYAKLIKNMWSDKLVVASSMKFKQVIGEFAPRFSGYEQQDSSELLSFLLDGLHEDLNRVFEKPPTQPVESDGRTDEVVAAEAWQVHLKRNQSVIVDTCQGQLKSRVQCPLCERVSITFDPFMFLSLDLPTVHSRLIRVAVIRASPLQHPPAIYGCTLAASASVLDLRRDIVQQTGIETHKLVICDVYGSRILCKLSDDYPVRSMIPSDEIVCFEVDGMTLQHFELEKKVAKARDGVAGESGGTSSSKRSHGLGNFMDIDEFDTGYDAEPSMYPQFGVGESDDGFYDLLDDGYETIPLGGHDAGSSKLTGTYRHAHEQPLDSHMQHNDLTPRHTVSGATASLADSSIVVPQIVHQEVQHDPFHDQYPSIPPTRTCNVGIPLLIALPRGLTNGQVRQAVWDRVQPHLYASGNVGANDDECDDLDDFDDFDGFGGGNGGSAPISHGPLDKDIDESARVFELYTIDSSGLTSVSPGEIIPYDEQPFDDQNGNFAFAVRWTSGAFLEYYRHTGTFDMLPNHSGLDDMLEAEAKSSESDGLRLSDCLDEFTVQETLSEQDPWYCSQCSKFQQATKKFDLWKLPPVLYIQLKRFSFDSLMGEKNDSLVHFPIDGLDLSPWVVNPESKSQSQSESHCVYDLFAVSNHYGGMGGGHYTAFAKNLIDSNWYEFDDSSVTPIESEQIVSSSAYVLCYRRRNLTAGTVTELP
jgi:ubiquitin C-terminal hydrolase